MSTHQHDRAAEVEAARQRVTEKRRAIAEAKANGTYTPPPAPEYPDPAAIQQHAAQVQEALASLVQLIEQAPEPPFRDPGTDAHTAYRGVLFLPVTIGRDTYTVGVDVVSGTHIMVSTRDGNTYAHPAISEAITPKGGRVGYTYSAHLNRADDGTWAASYVSMHRPWSSGRGADPSHTTRDAVSEAIAAAVASWAEQHPAALLTAEVTNSRQGVHGDARMMLRALEDAAERAETYERHADRYAAAVENYATTYGEAIR